MLRSIRLRAPASAVHWLNQVASQPSQAGGVSAQERLSKLLWYSATTDNVAVYLMQHASLYQFKKWRDADLSPLQLLCWELSRSPKPYEIEATAAAYMKAADVNVSENKDYSTEILISNFTVSLAADPKSSESFSQLYELYSRDAAARKGAVDAFREVLKIGFGDDCFKMWSILEGDFRTMDEKYGLPFLLLGFVAEPMEGQEVREGDTQEALAVIDQVSKFDETLPDWAQPTDKRFGESWLARANMVLMYREYGRVHQDDEGIMFRTKGGEWKPVTKNSGNGVYQVQSESDPMQFYEVFIGEDSKTCTCPGHVFRGAICKHINWVLADQDELPFKPPVS